MHLSFIITSYNILPWLDRCLDSLIPCLRPGDEVIVVDDGSTDGSAEAILARQFGPEIAYQPIVLGANTPGGVGTAGNIGLRAATRDGVFFVDGDDWLLPEGMNAARRAFETAKTDILIANYVEHNEATDDLRRPADTSRWVPVRTTGLAGGRPVRQSDPTFEAVRRQALSLIAVPWRKFYTRAFLTRADLLFPEGDFFYEDNPFHWAVCLAATSIAFSDRAICAHRIGRPGQTMAATGAELTAFFTHYESIAQTLHAQGHDETSDLWDMLADWIVGNMAWHLPRLRPAALWDYAMAASPVIGGLPEPLWARLRRGRFAGAAVLRTGEQLRKMSPADVALMWQAEMNARRSGETDRKLSQMQGRINQLEGALREARAQIGGLQAGAEFEALQRLAALPPGPQTGAQDSAPDAPETGGDTDR